MIHILQSVSNMDRGGIESMLMNYYRHLDRTRFQFDFLVNKKKPGFFDDEIRALGGRIFQSPGVAPQSYPAYLRSMQQLLAQHPEIKVLHAHNEAMQLFALEGAKKAGLPVRIAHAHNTRLPKDAKLPIKWFCKQFIPGAATDYWACGRKAGIYYFGQSAWDARGVTLRNAIDLDRFGYRPQVRAKLRAEYGLNDKLVVGCVARLMAQKNHTRLLDIFAALKKVRPDSCLLLVGEGELRAELEAKAARQDARFRVIHQKNAGVGAARNAGLAAARGTYVQFLDSDDALEPQMVEVLCRTAKQTDADLILFGGYEEHYAADGTRTGCTDIAPVLEGVYRGDPCPQLFPQLSAMSLVTRQLFRRRCIEEGRCRFTDYKIAEDALFFVSFYRQHLHCVVGIPEKLYRYKLRASGSASQSYHPERLTDNFYLSDAVEAVARDWGLQDARSRNDRIKLALLKVRLCAVVIALSSWNNRR